jgi:hypothetical protein
VPEGNGFRAVDCDKVVKSWGCLWMRTGTPSFYFPSNKGVYLEEKQRFLKNNGFPSDPFQQTKAEALLFVANHRSVFTKNQGRIN